MISEVKANSTRPAFEARAVEAAALIDTLIEAGLTPTAIAGSVQVSERTIYRWWREGHAPHPLMLEGLRRLGQR